MVPTGSMRSRPFNLVYFRAEFKTNCLNLKLAWRVYIVHILAVSRVLCRSSNIVAVVAVPQQRCQLSQNLAFSRHSGHDHTPYLLPHEFT